MSVNSHDRLHKQNKCLGYTQNLQNCVRTLSIQKITSRKYK